MLERAGASVGIAVRESDKDLIPSYTIVGRDTCNQQIAGINQFLRGIQTLLHVVDTASQDRFDPQSTTKILDFVVALGYVGSLSTLQGGNTMEEVKPAEVSHMQAYLAQLGYADISLATSEGLQTAGEVLGAYLDSFETATAYEDAAQEVPMTQLDLDMRTILFSLICHDIKGEIAGLKGLQQLRERRLEKGRDGEDFDERILLKWSSLAATIHSQLAFYFNPFKGESKQVVKWQDIIAIYAQNATVSGPVGVQKTELSHAKVSCSEVYFASLVTNCLQNSSRAGATAVEIIVRHNKQYLFIHFVDNGTGLSQEIRKNGFNGAHGYTDAASNKASTGTAMRVLHYMAQEYGGKLYCHNRRSGQRGSIITLALPILGEEETLEELVKTQ